MQRPGRRQKARAQWCSSNLNLRSQRKTSRHWSLTRIEWKPFRSPLSASSRLPGGERRSRTAEEPLSMSSLTSARPATSCGNRRTRLVGRPWYRSYLMPSLRACLI